MAWSPIQKSLSELPVVPHVQDYEAARAAFSWPRARQDLAGLPGGKGLNIAYEAIDRHAAGPLAAKTALRWLGKAGAVQDFSYEQMRQATNRVAHVLQRLGVSKGDRV
ncbi:MAG TPA: hypothetical protein PKD86_07050, partial [Gemmatales bacterium]|nr:hypothetical protein [Gemmatales bacterium]